MLRQTTLRRSTRSTALVASALAVVGSFGAPAALTFADAPPASNAQTTATETADAAAETQTPNAPNAVVEKIEIQEFVAPTFSADRPVHISAEDARKFEALVDLYAYAYPLVLSNEIKRETTSRFFLSTANETFYFPRLPDARYRATEFPNVDSIFATAWLDLAREPQIVVAPTNTNAPFSLEIVDAWSNVVASFDEKSLAELPTFQIAGRSVRALALVGPNSPKPTRLPAEIRVVESPSSLALVVARVFVKNSTRSGAFGTRPVVQTLYDFATVAASTFTSELKEEKTTAARNATPSDADKSASQTEPPTRSQSANDADAPPAADEQETKLNQDLTPPQTDAFERLKRLYVAQNAAPYAERSDDKESQVAAPAADATPNAASSDEADAKKATQEADASADTTSVSEKDAVSVPQNDDARTDAKNDAKSQNENVSPDDDATNATSEKTPLKERADAAFEAGERNYERERNEERRDVTQFWREAEKREREAAQSFDATYDGVKRWFRRRLENDEHFWSRFDEALRQDARRDLRQFERLVETPRPTRPWFEGPVDRVARMSPEKYWSTFVELLKTNPPTDANAKIANALQTLGIEPGKSAKFDANLRKLSQGAFAISRKKIEIAAQSEIWRNASPTNWIVFKNLGDYGDDYLFRAGAASVAFGVNVEKNVVYPFAFLDASGEPLDGAASYILRFSPNDEPPTDFLWSLTLYDADGYLVRNECGKYGVRSDEPLKRNPDGSVEILIQHDKPQGDTINWIPAPRGPFVLAMRVYRPTEKALNGAWTPPAIQKIQRETTAQ